MYYKDYSIDKYAKGGIFKDKLIGSSPNYDGILKLLKQFFYSPNIFLTEDEIGGSYYVINNSKGKINDYYVFFSKGRYRFFEKDKVDYDERVIEQRDKSEIISKQSKLKNKNFVESMQDFLENNNIKGTATTYGFSISKNFDYKEKVALVEKKLKELDIKYKTDFTNTWNVMFKLDKNQILNYKQDIKVADVSKTKDIEQVEINKDSNMDKEIQALEIALKYSGANTRLRIEKEISSLKIAQKYEKPSKIDNKYVVGEAQDEGKGYSVIKKSDKNGKYPDFVLFVYKTKKEAEAKAKQLNEKPSKIDNPEDKLKGNKEAKIVYDNLPRILVESDDEIISYKPKETYNERLVNLALKIDKTMLTEAHANWRTHEVRENNVKNLLYKLMNNNVDSTLKLLELVKTIPKYLHESIDIFQETYDRVLYGKINSDDGAIYLSENDYEVTNEIYDRLRLAEKRYEKNLKGLEVHDIITVKGKNGNKDFPANFRGFTNDGKLVVVYDGGNQMTINADEYY
jgi:hypothetical protein